MICRAPTTKACRRHSARSHKPTRWFLLRKTTSPGSWTSSRAWTTSTCWNSRRARNSCTPSGKKASRSMDARSSSAYNSTNAKYPQNRPSTAPLACVPKLTRQPATGSSPRSTLPKTMPRTKNVLRRFIRGVTPSSFTRRVLTVHGHVLSR